MTITQRVIGLLKADKDSWPLAHELIRSMTYEEVRDMFNLRHGHMPKTCTYYPGYEPVDVIYNLRATIDKVVCIYDGFLIEHWINFTLYERKDNKPTTGP